MGDIRPKPIKTLNAGDGGGANNCMLISVMAAVPDLFNIHSTSDKSLSTPNPIRHRHGGYVELSSLNGAAASMRAILANVIETSVDSPVYGELARDLPNFTLGGYDDPFLSTSVQKCMKAGDLSYDLPRLREAAKCIADNVRDVKSRRMMANVELGYWTIYLRQRGVTLETIGNLIQFDRMDKHLTDHLRRKDGNRLVVIYNDGSHYQLVADDRWIDDVYTTGETVEPFKPDDEVVNWAKEAQEQEDAWVAGDLLLNESKKEIIAELHETIVDDDELERKIKEIKKFDSLEDLERYSTLKAALVKRISGLAMDIAEQNRMIATVKAMTSVDEIVQYDELVDMMMSGGASKSTGYLFPAALAFVTLVMSMVPR
jgi:hypothetical protein